MTGPSHIVLALASSVALSRAASFAPSPLEVIILCVGALLPDIDGNGSITRPGTILKRFLGNTLSQLLNAIVVPFAFLIRILFGHRGLTHSLLVPCLIFALEKLLGSAHWLSFGYLTHILGDLMTPKGVPLFSPILKSNFSLKVFKTGSILEWVFVSILFVYTVIFGVQFLPSNTQEAIKNLLNSNRDY
jgi:inner membrane protein